MQYHPSNYLNPNVWEFTDIPVRVPVSMLKISSNLCRDLTSKLPEKHYTLFYETTVSRYDLPLFWGWWSGIAWHARAKKLAMVSISLR